jgi:hypothetical protein
MVVALIALVVAMAGTGYAASKINGSSIRPHSVPGNRIKANGLGGKQIDESKLATVPQAKLSERAADSDRLDGLRSSDFLRVAGKAADAEKLDGIDAAGFIQGAGRAFVGHGSVDVSVVFFPDQARQTLGSIPGLGSFEVVGSNSAPGDACRVNFTNTSGVAVSVVAGSTSTVVADGATLELVGLNTRPASDNSTFTVMTADAGKFAAGQAAVRFGTDSLCGGGVAGLTDG